jgi:hypothetical protein
MAKVDVEAIREAGEAVPTGSRQATRRKRNRAMLGASRAGELGAIDGWQGG